MKKTLLSVLALLVAFGLSSAAFASAKLNPGFNEAHKPAKAKCATCHVSKTPKKDAWELNAYGKDMVEKAVLDAKSDPKKYDYEKLKGLDSDGDGVKNGDEIAKGTDPSDPASK